MQKIPSFEKDVSKTRSYLIVMLRTVFSLQSYIVCAVLSFSYMSCICVSQFPYSHPEAASFVSVLLCLCAHFVVESAGLRSCLGNCVHASASRSGVFVLAANLGSCPVLLLPHLVGPHFNNWTLIGCFMQSFCF